MALEAFADEEPVHASRNDAGRPAVSLGIALSGGGVRAALYSLGVMLYLSHAGLNRQVSTISSVSGGSIVNATLAMHADYSHMNREEFDGFTRRLAGHLMRHGAFYWAARPFAIGVVTYMTMPVLFMSIERLSGAAESWFSWSRYVFWSLVTTIPATVVLVLFATAGRGYLQRETYKTLLRKVRKHSSATKESKNPDLSDFTDSRVRHLLCATELTSGQPFYMDKFMVHSPAYGTGTPTMPVKDAIYASAAFPIGFPPLRLKSKPLRLGGGRVEDRPKFLVLSDGGVFNNLGTDTFEAWRALAMSPFAPDARFPSLPQVDQVLVVNASSPPKLAALPRLPLLRNVVAAARIMSVLYENTLRPRVDAIMAQEGTALAPIIIDIALSPIELARRIETKYAESPVARRAACMRAQLDRYLPDAYWFSYSSRGSLTKTVLSSLGEASTIRLLMLGYISATVACHARLGSPGLSTVPPEDWFRGLLEDKVQLGQDHRPQRRTRISSQRGAATA